MEAKPRDVRDQHCDNDGKTVRPGDPGRHHAVPSEHVRPQSDPICLEGRAICDGVCHRFRFRELVSATASKDAEIGHFPWPWDERPVERPAEPLCHRTFVLRTISSAIRSTKVPWRKVSATTEIQARLRARFIDSPWECVQTAPPPHRRSNTMRPSYPSGDDDRWAVRTASGDMHHEATDRAGRCVSSATLTSR